MINMQDCNDKYMETHNNQEERMTAYLRNSMNTPVTDEYAIQKIKEALAVGDYTEADKWKLCLQGNAEVRLVWRQRERTAQEAVLQAWLREMYARP